MLRDNELQLSNERALLGGVLRDGRTFDELEDVGVTAADFTDPSLRKIYEAAKRLNDAGEPIDAITVTNQLRRDGQYDAVGGAAAVSELEARMPASAHVGVYARDLRGFATKRALLAASEEIFRSVQIGGRAEDLVDKAQEIVLSIETGGTQEPLTGSQLASLAFSRIEAYQETGELDFGLTSGFRALDDQVGGWRNGELVILAARPSMGKTSLALQTCCYAAQQRVGAVFFSLEMSGLSVSQRALSTLSGVPLSHIRNGALTTGYHQRAARAADELGAMPLHVCEQPGLSVGQIRSVSRRIRNRSGIGLIVIDYLQLISGTNPRNRHQELSVITKGLKNLARELDVPVLCLSQLNRGLESRSNKRPVMSDLRESGAIEEDADVIAMLYRHEYYTRDDCPEEDRGVAEVIIAKNRNGPTGTIRLGWSATTTSFREAEE